MRKTKIKCAIILKVNNKQVQEQQSKERAWPICHVL